MLREAAEPFVEMSGRMMDLDASAAGNSLPSLDDLTILPHLPYVAQVFVGAAILPAPKIHVNFVLNSREQECQFDARSGYT